MLEPTQKKSSIKFEFLQIDIHDLQYEDDGDWLDITTTCTTEDSMVRVRGPIITAAQLVAFGEQIRKLSRGLFGTAILASEEPYLNIQVKAEKSWQATMVVEITPDYFNQKHSYTTSLDKSDLENLAAQLNEVKDK
ncbi:hypothetical protein KA183_06285 [bacterium]|nr:hypothetical protein [bacterium]